MSQKLYSIEPTKELFDEWKHLSARMNSLCGIARNRMFGIVTESDLSKHRVEVAKFIAELKELNDRTMSLFESVTLEEAKAFAPEGGSQEIAKLLGIEQEPLPF